MSVILTMLVFLFLLGVLYHLSRQHVNYSKRVFVGLGFGILLGAAIQALFGVDSPTTTSIMDWVSIVGTAYIKFLQMLVVPLIFVSLVKAFTQMEGQAHIGKISSRIVMILLVTVAIAATIGIASVVLFNLDGAKFAQGAQEIARIESLQERNATVADLTLPQQIISFIPANIFEDFAGLRPTSNIAVVIFSAMVGIAYLGIVDKYPDEANTFKSIINAFHRIVLRLVTIVLRIAPYGIFALMTNMIASSSYQSLLNMGTMLIASYLAFAVMFAIHALLLMIHQISPVTYFKKAWNVLSFAFTSRSSGASLPINIATQEELLGVDTTTANFSATLGLSIGQNGCAGIYPAMLVAIVAPTVGMNLADPMVWLTIIATITISSIGVAGVGGGATFASLIVFGTLGLPIEIIGLMVSIEPVIDMGRTALNVNDSMLAGILTSQQLHTLNKNKFNDMTLELTEELS